MNIAVCDREKCVLELIKQYFARLELSDEVRVIDYFNEVESMLISLKENAYDLFLLGDNLAGIYKISHVIPIRGGEGRPVSYERFRRQITLAWKKFCHDGGTYTGIFNRNYIKLAFDDIYYFESSQRMTYVWTGQDKYRVNGTIQEEYQKLPEYRFVRISQGILVNLQHIKTIEKDMICLENDVVVYPSVRRVQEARQKWRAYRWLTKL